MVTGSPPGSLSRSILSALAAWQWRYCGAATPARRRRSTRRSGRCTPRRQRRGAAAEPSARHRIVALGLDSRRVRRVGARCGARTSPSGGLDRRPAARPWSLSTITRRSRGWLWQASDGVVRIVDLNSGSTLQALRLVDRALDPPAQWPGASVRFSPDGMLARGGRPAQALDLEHSRTWQRWDDPVEHRGILRHRVRPHQ